MKKSSPFAPGIDVLLEEHRDWLRGARIGLVAHSASLDSQGRSTPEKIHRTRGIKLGSIFGPEHGFGGKAGAGELVEHTVHPTWNVPIFSLYGQTKRPTADMLKTCDLLLYDLQDLGVRCYTYVSTLRNLMEAAAEHKLPLVVADRPIPFPSTIDGPLLDPACESFVGCIPAPMVYGMTPGETALWLQSKLDLDIDLRVAPMRYPHREKGWPRSTKWNAPSPAIRSLACALAYPVTVFCEAFPQLDCARRTSLAFQVLCAPWLRVQATCKTFNRLGLPGIHLEPYQARQRKGVRLRITHPKDYLPVTTGLALFDVIGREHKPEHLWENTAARPAFFDLLMGSKEPRRAILRGESALDIATPWRTRSAPYLSERASSLLYEIPSTPPLIPLSIKTSSMPRKAVVLAAGFGTRLLPLTHSRPKPLFPLWNKPMLQHVLDMLTRWGVREVTLNLHHGADTLWDYIRKTSFGSLKVNAVYEPNILGTGGPLQQMKGFFDDQPFWLINADVAADLDPAPLVKVMNIKNHLAALWMVADRGPRTVQVNRGTVSSFRSKQPGRKGTYTFSGLHLVSPSIVEYLPNTGFSSIITGYETAMKKGQRIAGVPVASSYWSDVGNPEDYINTHHEVRERYLAGLPGGALYDPSTDQHLPKLRREQVSLRGVVALAPGTNLEAGAVIKDSIIWENAHIHSHAQLENAIVGAQTSLDRPAQHIVLNADAACGPDQRAALVASGLSWPKTTAEILPQRGSQRSFIRAFDGKQSRMLITYDPGREENNYYAEQTRFLHALGLPVPRLYIDDVKNNLLVLEDVGRDSFEALRPSWTNPQTLKKYKAVLDMMLILHEKGPALAQRKHLPLMKGFNQALYEWEVDYFLENFLFGVRGATAKKRSTVRDELRKNYRKLLRAPQALIHRDLQSSNLLVQKGKPILIDFQGMRMGHAAYDLASLLCDPYVSLSESMQEELLAYYTQRSTHGEVIRKDFWPAAIQRLAQALGAYGRLSRLQKGERFARYIPPARTMILRAISYTPGLKALEKEI